MSTGLDNTGLTAKEVSSYQEWSSGSMMWDFEKRADTSGGNGTNDGRAARPDAFSIEVNHSINAGEKIAQAGGPNQGASKGDQDRIARLGIATALEKMQGAVENYNKQFPNYPNGQAIVDAVRGAYENGRIRVGNDSTLFNGKNNPFSTKEGVIYFNPLSHPTSSSIPGLLAHEGYHLIEKTRPHSYASERAAFDAQYGFGHVLNAPGNVRTPDSWIHEQYGY